MTTIDFYTHVTDRLDVAARIVAKAYAAHGNVRVLTSAPAITHDIYCEQPYCSADGSRLAFLAEDSAPKAPPNTGPDSNSKDDADKDSEEKQAQIFVMPMNGGDPIRVTEAKHGVEEFAWSPDGTKLAYLASVPVKPVASMVFYHGSGAHRRERRGADRRAPRCRHTGRHGCPVGGEYRADQCETAVRPADGRSAVGAGARPGGNRARRHTCPGGRGTRQAWSPAGPPDTSSPPPGSTAPLTAIFDARAGGCGACWLSFRNN